MFLPLLFSFGIGVGGGSASLIGFKLVNLLYNGLFGSSPMSDTFSLFLLSLNSNGAGTGFSLLLNMLFLDFSFVVVIV